MFGWDVIAAGFCLIVGLSLLAGYFSQFRERGYVGLLGASFLALFVAAKYSQTELAIRNIALAVAGVFFLLAFISAFLQTRRQLADIKRRHLANQEQLLAIVMAERERREREGKKDDADKTDDIADAE